MKTTIRYKNLAKIRLTHCQQQKTISFSVCIFIKTLIMFKIRAKHARNILQTNVFEEESKLKEKIQAQL